MQIALKLLPFDFRERSISSFRRQFINPVLIGSRQLHGEQVSRGLRAQFALVGLYDPREDSRFCIRGDSLGTQSLPLSLMISHLALCVNSSAIDCGMHR